MFNYSDYGAFSSVADPQLIVEEYLESDLDIREIIIREIKR